MGFETLFLFLIVVGAVVGIIRWILFFRAAAQTWVALTRALDSSIPQTEDMLRAWGSSQKHTPQQQAAISAQLLQMNNQLRQLDALHRARYEVRVGEITGLAASHGISITPPSW